MSSQVYPHLDVCGPHPDPDAGDVFWRSNLSSAILATRVEYPFLPSVSTNTLPPLTKLHSERPLQSLEDNLLVGDLVYEYLARETNGASGPYFPDRSVNSPLVEYTHSGLATLPIIMFVPASRYFLVFTERHLSGAVLRSPSHLPPPHSLRNRHPHYAADNRLQNRDAVKARHRSTAFNESGAAVCARNSSAISTNANDTLRTLESG